LDHGHGATSAEERSATPPEVPKLSNTTLGIKIPSIGLARRLFCCVLRSFVFSCDISHATAIPTTYLTWTVSALHAQASPY